MQEVKGLSRRRRLIHQRWILFLQDFKSALPGRDGEPVSMGAT